MSVVHGYDTFAHARHRGGQEEVPGRERPLRMPWRRAARRRYHGSDWKPT